MNILKNKMQRRDFLRNIAKAGLTTAFAGQFALSSKAFAAAGTAKRFVMVYYPNGCVRDTWHSYATGPLNASSFDTSPLSPLGKYAQQMLPIKNLTFAGHGGSTGHPEACSGVFSGGMQGATTFNVSIAQALGGQLTNQIFVGVFSSKAGGTNYMPFTDENGVKISVPDNPQLIYDNQIADVVGNTTGDPSPETVRRRRVLESLHENLDVLQANSLNVVQQGKLLQHEQALTYYQNILNNSLNVGSGTYSRPTIGMTGKDADAERIAQAQIKNIAMAFEANITRSATFQFMSAQDESVRINFESIRDRMGEYGVEPKLYYNETRSHVSSHNESALFNTQNYWYNLMISQLMDELATRPDSAYGGTLLDNTLILVMSEVGGGNHQMANPGIYVAGGASGAINAGNAIDAGGAGMSNLYWDISNAFGLGWSNYGNSFGGINGFLA